MTLMNYTSARHSYCPLPLLSRPVTITDNGNGKGLEGCYICPLPLIFCPLLLPFDVSISKKVKFLINQKGKIPLSFFCYEILNPCTF